MNKIHAKIETKEQEPLKLKHEPDAHDGADSNTTIVAESWVENCLQNHAICRRRSISIGPSRRYARILDVGDLHHVPEVQLREAADVPDTARYITLSHCWGGAEIPVLMEEKLEEYLASILIESLPPVFRDAIALTRRFKVRYLWIDSLCIIQDSQDDWLRHASLMDDIYRGGFLNIAATRASDPFQGMFAERSTVLLRPLRLQLSSSSTNGFYDVGDDFSEAWVRDVAFSPLAIRAWVYQERLLAPRVVHFAKSQLYWECAELRTNEASAISGIDHDGFRHEFVDYKKWDPLAESIVQKPTAKCLGLNYIWTAYKAMHGEASKHYKKALLASDPEALTRMRQACFGDEQWTETHPLIIYWAHIVSTYSMGKLTRVTDRLIALAGLERILHLRTGIRYVA